jgi:hypothetical protein
MNRNKNTLLMTATVTPPTGVPELLRTNPDERMEDYLQALEFYCKVPENIISRIVFIENSSADLSKLREVVVKSPAKDRVEFVSFFGLDHPPSYGRGYGEFKLLDYAMTHSSILAAAEPTTMLWKVTGRYRILNIGRIIGSSPSTVELYCDLRRWPIPWMDLRIFGCTMSGYKRYLEGIYNQLREDTIQTAPEVYLHKVLSELAVSDDIITRFRHEPFVVGIRGKDSKNFASGLNLMKYLLLSSRRALGFN